MSTSIPATVKRQDRPVDLVALHGEQADLGHGELFLVDLVVAADLLVGPDHLVEGEGDLLLGLELDDVGDPLLLDRRQLDELHQPRLAGHRDGDLAALQVVAIGEGGQRLAHQLVGIGVGLAEDLGILDEVERLGHDLLGGLARDELERLECGLADVDSPDGLDLSHADELLRGIRDREPGACPVEPT